MNYVKAYSEVSCLLDCLPKSYIERIPEELVKNIKKEADEHYYINIDTSKKLSEQEFSKETKDLIAVLKFKYWSTEDEQAKLIELFKKNEKIIQEKQNSEVLSDSQDNANKADESIEDESIIEYKKDSLIKRIIKKILSCLKKSNCF